MATKKSPGRSGPRSGAVPAATSQSRSRGKVGSAPGAKSPKSKPSASSPEGANRASKAASPGKATRGGYHPNRPHIYKAGEKGSKGSTPPALIPREQTPLGGPKDAIGDVKPPKGKPQVTPGRVKPGALGG